MTPSSRTRKEAAENPYRFTAFELASSSTKNLRAAAAEVLAATPGDTSELTRLEDLVKAEPIDSIRNALNQASHRISSGGIGEALAALVELLDLTQEIGPIDPTVLVPDPDHHERFIAWIDKARARADNTHDPGTFIEAAINVADQMVDLALIAATEAGQPTHLKPAEVAALRANSSVRLDTGALLGRQQLQQIVTWLPICTVLRRKRGAHPSPSGSTRPQIIVAEDLITARSLLKDITSGWILDMRRFAISV